MPEEQKIKELTLGGADETSTDKKTPVTESSEAKGGSGAKPVVKPKAKSRKKWWIGMVIVLVVVVIVVLSVILVVNNRKNEVEENTDKGETAEDELIVADDEAELAEESDEDRVQAAMELIKTTITTDLKKQGVSYVIEDVDSAPLYRTDDLKVFTNLDRGYGMSIKAEGNGSVDGLTALSNAADGVIAALKAKGFTEYSPRDNGSSSYLNEKTGVICYLDLYASPTSFDCGHISWLSAERKAVVNELAEALRESEGGLNEFTAVMLGDNEVKDGNTKPFQQISAGLGEFGGFGGAVGLFYRTSPDAKWKFFAAAQGPISCDEYNTVDLQKTYAGDACWDDKSQELKVVEVK